MISGFPVQVDMTKVRLEVVKPWVTEKITGILGMEDDVVIEYVFNQLEAEKVSVGRAGRGCPSGCEACMCEWSTFFLSPK